MSVASEAIPTDSTARTPDGSLGFKRKRSRAGCLVCRNDRKGCNEEHPTCARCARLGYACVWPNGDNDRSIRQRWKPLPRKRATLTDTPESTPPPPPISASSSIATLAPSDAVSLPGIQGTTTWSSNLPALPSASQSAALPPATTSHSIGPSHELTADELFRLLGMPDTTGPSMNSHFWQDTSLYGLEYDVREIDTLLALTGQQAEDSDHNLPASQDRVAIPRQQLEAVAKKLPRKIYALIDKIVKEQEGNQEPILPIAYLINMAMWMPSRAVEELVSHAKHVYPSGSTLRNVVRSVDEAASHVLAVSPASSVKQLITVEEICEIPNISVETKMHALMDLGFRHFFIAGAPKWYEHLTEVELFLCKYLKSGQTLNLGALVSMAHFGLINFCWGDICRSVALAKPTTFPYVFQPEDRQRFTGTEFTNGSIDTVNCLISDISTFRFMLDRDISSRIGVDTLNSVYQAKANAILHNLRIFTPVISPEDADPETDSIENVATVAVQEVWRQAALIHFYQSVYRCPATHAPLQACLQQILHLGKIIEMTGPILLEALLSLPLFLAASVAVTKTDRQACRNRLNGLGNAVAHKQNTALIEHVWAERDRLGQHIDWHDYASEANGPSFM